MKKRFNKAPAFAVALITIVAFTQSAHANITVTLHLNALGNTTVSVSGSGTTGADNISTLTNSLTEQWLGMTGNPFDDTTNLDNADFFFVNPIALTPTVNITGIQIDNDGTGDLQDDFRIYVNTSMSPNTPYAADGYSELTSPLAFSALNVGTFTDDSDGGTTFLGGFSLVITTTPIPEPSTAWLLGLGALGCVLLRRKIR